MDKKRGPVPQDTQVEEYRACSDGFAGFVYWCEQYARIEDKDSHRAVPFRLYACQKRIMKQVFLRRWLRILKARRLGVTWLFAAHAVWLMTFRKMQTFGYIIHKLDFAQDFVDRCDFIAARIPVWLRPIPTRQTRSELEYTDNESWIRALAATRGAADSVAADVVVVDEATKIEEKQAGLLSGILQSIEPTVETSKGLIVLIAKSEGPQGLFYRGWKEAEKGDGKDKYKNVFLSWKMRPGRSPSWYKREQELHASDPLFMPRNYPSNADEAFQQAEGRVYATFNMATHVGRILPDGRMVGEGTQEPLYVADHWPKWRGIDWGGRDPFVCYDDQTEVLTENGWKLFGDTQPNESVATLNMKTEALEWQIPEAKIVQRYSGPMIRCEPRIEGANFCVTPNHKMVLRDRNAKGLRTCDADSLPTGTTIPVGWGAQVAGDDHAVRFEVPPAGMNKTAKNLPPVTREQFSRFLGWWLSDGCITSGKYVRIAQKTKTDELWRLLKDEMGWLGSTHEQKTGVTDFSIGNVSLVRFLQSHCGTGRAQTKRIPRFIMEWGNRCLQALLDGLIAGDGSRKTVPQRLVAFRSTSKGLADDVQEIACRLGLATTLTWKKCQSGYVKSTTGYWTVLFCAAQQSSVQKVKDKLERIHYDGMIYCLTVPNGTLVVRRGNRPMACGNCLWVSKIDNEGVRLTVDPACEKTIGEFLAYRYKPHTDYFEDKNNHACDSLRYMVETFNFQKGHYHIYRELYLPNSGGEGLEVPDLAAMIKDMSGDESFTMSVADKSQPNSINSMRLHGIPCMPNQHYLKEGSSRRGLIAQGVRMVNALLIGTGEFLPQRVRPTPRPEDLVRPSVSGVSISLEDARLLNKKRDKMQERDRAMKRKRRMTVTSRFRRTPTF